VGQDTRSERALRRLDRNITKFYSFVGFFWLVFWQPVVVLFWLASDVSLTQVYLIKAIHGLTMILLEVPSGVLADHLGKRLSLFFATLAGTASLTIYVFGDGFYLFLVAEILAALGTSLISGADSAFVHETLNALGRERDFSLVMGRVGSIRYTAQAVSSILGGLIGSVSYRLTMVVSLITTLPTTLITFSLAEPKSEDSPVVQKRPYLLILSSGFKLVTRHREVRWLVLYFAFLASTDLLILWSYQPYMELSGLPVAVFGIAFMAFNLTAALAAHNARRIERAVSYQGVLILLPSLMIVAISLMGVFIGVWGVLLILCLQVVRGVRVPLLHPRILEHVPGDSKATVLSFVSLTGRLIFFLVSPLFGWVAETRGIPVALNIAGLTLLLAFTGLALDYFLHRIHFIRGT
jgi:MFS family permease